MTDQQSKQQWTIERFRKNFFTSDPDWLQVALEELLDHLNEIDSFPEIDNIGDEFIPQTLNYILSDTSYINDFSLRPIFDLLMKLICPLASKIPVKYIPVFYETLFTKLSLRNIAYFTILGGVIEDSINLAPNFSIDRQEEIGKYMINKLTTLVNNPPTDQLKNLALSLLTLTVENLHHVLKPEMINDLKNLITSSLKSLSEKDVESKEFIEVAKSVSTVSKVYCTLIPEDELPHFFDYLKELKNERLETLILSSIIIYHPQFFKLSPNKDDMYTFPQYLDKIIQQLYNIPESEDYSIATVEFISECLGALSVFVNKFANEMTEEQINKLICLLNDFVGTGCERVDVEGEADDKDNEIVIDDDVEIDHDDDQFEDVHVAQVSNTWKIRVAAIKFGECLVNELSEYCLPYLQDENYGLTYKIDDLICDSAIGAKLEALELLRDIIHHCKNDLPSETIDRWLHSLISQINVNVDPQAHASLIDTFTFIINEMGSVPTQLSLTATKNITAAYKDTTIDSTLAFIITVLNYSNEVSIINPIIGLINKILAITQKSMIPRCLTAVSRIYYYYHLHCKNEKSLHNDIDALNKKVLEFCKDEGESKPYAITTVSVFVACCPGLSTVQKSIDEIIGSLEDRSVARVSTAAVVLIAASESFKELSPIAKNLLTKLDHNLQLNDTNITNITLWLINILLHKKILGTSDCQNIIGALFENLNNGQESSRLLSIKVLNKIYSEGCDSKVLSSIVDCLTTSPLSPKIISEIAELVIASAKKSIDNVKPFVEALIAKVGSSPATKDDASSLAILYNVAFLIGIAASPNKDFGLSLISKIKGNLSSQGYPQTFALRCIGEIGSFNDLSKSNADLVKEIFKLVHSTDRNVFVPAAESIGLMSAGSPGEILKDLVKTAKSDGEKFLTAWLFAIKQFVKKANSFKKYDSQGVLNEIKNNVKELSDFLLPNSMDDFKETASVVSECLAGLVGISFEYSKTLIEQKSYVPVKSISIYMEEYSTYGFRSVPHKLTENEKEEILKLVEMADGIYDETKSMLDYAIMLIFKVALSKGLAKELLEANHGERIYSSIEYNSSQIIQKQIGTSVEAIDLARELKYTGLQCIELLIKSDVGDQSIDYQALSEQLLFSLEAEKLKPDFIQKALEIVTLLANSPNQDARDNAFTSINDCTTLDKIKDIESSDIANEILPTIYYTVIALHDMKSTSITPEVQRKLKNILLRHQNDPALKKIQEDKELTKSISKRSISYANGYVSSRLMEEFYPEAVSIFANN